MTETLKILSSLGGISGNEDEVRDYILSRALPFADEIKTDAMGNLMIFKKGRKAPSEKIMFAAHMDEVGFIVTSIIEDGYIRFGCVGGIDKRVLPGKKVLVGDKKIPGIIGMMPIHIAKKKKIEEIPEPDSMYIDAGFSSRDEAAEIIHPGDSIIFDSFQSELQNGYFCTKAVDDRVGCAAMLKLIEDDLPVDVWFSFNVQEEVGCRGSHTAAFVINPDIAIILEGTTATDIPDLPEEKNICNAGNGIVIPFMDGGTIYDRELSNYLRKIADDNGISHQVKHRIAGGTDASSIQRSNSGTKVAAISCAVRNIHTGASVAKLSEADDMLKLCRLYLESV